MKKEAGQKEIGAGDSPRVIETGKAREESRGALARAKKKRMISTGTLLALTRINGGEKRTRECGELTDRGERNTSESP